MEANKKENNIFGWLFLSLPLMWIVGQHPNDVANGFLILTICAFLIPYTRKFLLKELTLNRSQKTVTIIFLILYPLLIGLSQLMRVYVGGQGINFAYHCQIIETVSTKGGLYTSLLTAEPGVFRNFLLHHFNLFFFIPGLLGYLGIPGYFSLILSGVAIIILTILSLKKLLQFLEFSDSMVLILIILLMCNYTFRHSYVWGVEDEFFMVPFIFLSYYFLLKEKHWYVLITILLSFSVKESIPFYGGSFALMSVLLNYKKYKSFILKNNIPYLILFLLSVSFFWFYFFGQHLIFNKGYEHLDRMDTINSMFSLYALWNKIVYFALIFLPYLFFPLWFRKSWIYWIPALPYLALAFVSKSLYNIIDYYCIIPSTILFCAVLINLKDYRLSLQNSFPAGIAILLISITFYYGTWKPVKIILNGFKHNWVTQSSFSEVPQNSHIAVTESLFPLVADREKITFYPYDYPAPEKFDYLFIRKNEISKMPDSVFKSLQLDTSFSKLNDAVLVLIKPKK